MRIVRSSLLALTLLGLVAVPAVAADEAGDEVKPYDFGQVVSDFETGYEDELIMPPIDEDEPDEKPLTEVEKELVRRWIVEGASWPDGKVLARAEEQE